MTPFFLQIFYSSPLALGNSSTALHFLGLAIAELQQSS
jgi:hypothetical protein